MSPIVGSVLIYKNVKLNLFIIKGSGKQEVGIVEIHCLDSQGPRDFPF